MDFYTLICHYSGIGSPEALLFQKTISAFELGTKAARNDVREHLLSMGFNFISNHGAHSKLDTIGKWEEIAIPLENRQEGFQRSGHFAEAKAIQKVIDLGHEIYT